MSFKVLKLILQKWEIS